MNHWKNKTSKKKVAKKKVTKKILTNAEFAVKNEHFLDSVKKTDRAGFNVTASTRQASKFRNKKGVVYLFVNRLIGVN